MENATAKLLNLKFDDLEIRLKNYAQEAHVPIIMDEGLALLESFIALKRPQRILEIGTAIGYSAIRMHRVCGSEVYTVERNADMVRLATKNIQSAGLSDRIHIIHKDALEALDLVKDLEFDMLFIDAAKAQYAKFFNLYTPLLTEHGAVVCDNMLFHGLVEDKKNYENQSRSVRGLIRKLSLFHQTLLDNELYQTSVFPVGDGISVSVKK